MFFSLILTNKTDAASKAVNFIYYSNHLLKSRLWARGASSTNILNLPGDLIRIDYLDTPGLTNITTVTITNYNRFGLPRLVDDASGSHTLMYDHAARMVSDACTSGLLNGITVTNHFDPVNGRDMLKVTGLSSTLQHDYGFDTYGRLSSAAAGVYSANYGYLANSDLLQETTSKNNGTTKLTATRTWDFGYRLRDIANVVGSAPVTSHAYSYDGVDRRTRATLQDGSAWVYGYDDRNELTSGKRYWADNSPVAGQRYEYAYDTIGNRTTTKEGGDVNGANLRTESYTPNNLNQYTSQTVAGAVDIIGAAYATATATVNGQSTDRKVEYYHRELAVSNGSGPVYQVVTNTATLGASSSNVIGNVLVPPATQNFSYDADGNLTNDAVWIYQWDGENRLLSMSNLTTVATAARKKLDFTYDYLGRRSQKIVSTNSGSAWVTQSTNRFVYELPAGQAGGWGLVATINPASTILYSFVWGQDLSGTMDGAGGIGGLVLVADHGTGTYYFPAYDGNGNVTILVNASDSSTGARYEYSPFGRTIRATGPLTKSNPFRFSTKFADDESDLICYPHRFTIQVLDDGLTEIQTKTVQV